MGSGHRRFPVYSTPRSSVLMIPTRASAPSKSTRSSWILRDLAGVCRSTTRTHRSKAMYVYVGVLFKSLTDDSDLRSWEERAISALAGLDGGFRVKCTRGSLTFHILSSVTTLPFDVGNRVANVLAELTQDAADEITVLAGSAASLTNSVAPDRVKVVIRELLTGWGDDAKNGV